MIKIIRLINGEDIIGDITENKKETIINNPLFLYYEREEESLYMTPWLPLELVEENVATIPNEHIMTTVKPKQNVIDYYDEILKRYDEGIETILTGDSIDDENDEDDDINTKTKRVLH